MSARTLLYSCICLTLLGSCQRDPAEDRLSEEEALERHWEMGAEVYRAHGLDPQELYINVHHFRELYHRGELPTREELEAGIAERAKELREWGDLPGYSSKAAREEWEYKHLSPDYYQKGKALHLD